MLSWRRRGPGATPDEATVPAPSSTAPRSTLIQAGVQNAAAAVSRPLTEASPATSTGKERSHREHIAPAADHRQEEMPEVPSWLMDGHSELGLGEKSRWQRSMMSLRENSLQERLSASNQTRKRPGQRATFGQPKLQSTNTAATRSMSLESGVRFASRFESSELDPGDDSFNSGIGTFCQGARSSSHGPDSAARKERPLDESASAPTGDGETSFLRRVSQGLYDVEDSSVESESDASDGEVCALRACHAQAVSRFM